MSQFENDNHVIRTTDSSKDYVRENILAVGLVFFTSSASYLVTPILAILLVERGFSAALSGALIGMQLFIGRVAAPLTGWISDRIGARWSVSAGITLSAVAHYGLSKTSSLFVLTLMVALLGIGMALFGPASKALAVQNISNAVYRHKLFAWRNLATHGGVAAGSLLGTYFLSTVGKIWMLQGAAAIEILLAIVAIVFLSGGQLEITGPPFSRLLHIFRDRRILRGIIPISAYWAAYIQLSVGAPLSLLAAGASETLGLMFALNAVTVIALQLPLVRVTERLGFSSRSSFVWGYVLLLLGLPVLGLFSNWSWAPLAFAILSALGVILGAPAIDTWVSSWAEHGELGMYLGVAFVAMGLGAALGGFVGGWIHSAAVASPTPVLIWTGFALGLSGALLLLIRWSK